MKKPRIERIDGRQKILQEDREDTQSSQLSPNSPIKPGTDGEGEKKKEKIMNESKYRMVKRI